MRSVTAAAAAIGILASGCRAPVAEHVALGDSVDALHTAFVADSGKVRAIFLASPT